MLLLRIDERADDTFIPPPPPTPAPALEPPCSRRFCEQTNSAFKRACAQAEYLYASTVPDMRLEKMHLSEAPLKTSQQSLQPNPVDYLFAYERGVGFQATPGGPDDLTPFLGLDAWPSHQPLGTAKHKKHVNNAHTYDLVRRSNLVSNEGTTNNKDPVDLISMSVIVTIVVPRNQQLKCRMSRVSHLQEN